MDLRDFQSDFNFRRASDRRCVPDSGSGGFIQSLDTNTFLKNQSYTKSNDTLELCKKLNKMGISCDVADFGSSEFNKNLMSGASSVRQGFLQNNNFHGVSSQGKMRFPGLQDSVDSNGFKEMMAPKHHYSLALNGNRVSQTLGSGASYPEDSTMLRRYLKEPKISSEMPLSLVSMVEIYGSLNLMAKDQIGCRALQKVVEEGNFEAKFLFVEIIDHVTELSMDAFGNYLVQKLLHVSDEEQRTILVSLLTSKPVELLQICLNTYGTRVVQKMIEAVTTKQQIFTKKKKKKTKQQIEMVKSSLKPGFLALVKDLNGNHVLKSCLQSLGPNDNKFVLEDATKYFGQIATHRYGCCVLQCCLANSVGPQHERLVAEISRHSLYLSQDPYGNYVVQSLIEHQVSASKVLVQFRKHYAELATEKFSSHVIEKCLRKYPESRAEIVRELLSVPHFEQLLLDPYANYVINTALSVTKGGVRARLVEKVHRFIDCSSELQSSPYCKKILAILKK